jgi:acyl phosphate:glycerol-3-phosphate acyltransferase
MGWKPALFVMIIDIGKGVLSVLLWPRLFPVYPDMLTVQILAGSAAVLGHIWTVFAGFRGGKGVGTAFGVLLSLAPLASAATLIVWIALVAAFRFVSLGSLAAGIVFPLALMSQRRWLDPDLPRTLIWLGVVLGVLIFFTHRRNIVRLFQGKENRFGKEKQ